MKYLCLVLIFLLTLIFLSCGEKPSDINDPKTPGELEDNAPPLDVTDLKAVGLDKTVFLFWTEPEDIDEIEIEWSVCNSAGESQSLENSGGDDKTNDGGGVKIHTQDSSTKSDSSGYWSNWKESDENSLENGVTYQFTVRTIDDDENRSKGVTVRATPNKNAISLSAIAGNGAVHLECTFLEGLPSKNTVEYFEASNEGREGDKKTVPLKTGETSYCVEGLENGTRYGFRFCAELYGRHYTSKTVFCTPPRFLTNPDTERAVAIKCDGRVFLSWTYKEKDVFNNKDLFFPKGVNVYIDDEFIEEIAPTSANEEVNPEQSGNEIDLYDKYYTYTVDFEKYSALALRAVNEDGVEADALALPEATEVSLPIVDIKTEGLVPIGEGWESAKKEKKISSTLSLFNCEEDKKLDGVALTVKGRGNSSWENAPKKSYTLKFSSKQAILGMKRHKSWALVANYFDKTLLRNITAYELGRDVYKNMAWTPSAKSVHLFMNGVYEGIYAFTETNKIDENRLNIKNLEDCADDDDFYEYGYLLEANDRADENFNFKTNQNANANKKLVFSLKEPDGEDISEALREKIKGEVLEREAKLFADDFSDENSENYWKNYFDENSFIDWWIVSEFARNTDSNYFSSCYVYYEPKDKKLHAGPLWDFDLGFGNMRDLTEPDKTYTSDGVWLKRMFEDASFKKTAFDRWTKTLPELQAYLDESYSKNLAALQCDVDLNFTRWPILGKRTWKAPNDCDSRNTHQAEVDYFKAWCASRKAWMTNWLSDASISE